MILNPTLGGKKLPTLTNPGAAADLRKGKQLIDQYGNPLTGTMPELAAQTIVPGTSDQIIPAGRFLAGDLTIKACPMNVLTELDLTLTESSVVTASGLVNPRAIIGYFDGIAYLTKTYDPNPVIMLYADISGNLATVELMYSSSLRTQAVPYTWTSDMGIATWTSNGVTIDISALDLCWYTGAWVFQIYG